MRQLRVAGFVRDMGAGNVVSPILLAMRERGHETELYVEQGGKAEGRVKHPTITLGSIGAIKQELGALRPDVVVAGLSWPNRNLETAFEKTARALGIPVVHAEDSLKAFDRSPVDADLILSIDETAAALARSVCTKTKKVAVIGFAGTLPMTPRQESVEAFSRIRHETGAKILYSNDADPADSVATLSLLRECIKRTQGPVRLIFAPHPKFAPAIAQDGRTQAQVLAEVLGTIGHLLVPCPPGADGDEAAMLADATCSAYSTLLGRSASAGRQAVTLCTPESEAAFRAATTGRTPGLDRTWLMMMGCYPVVKVPTALDSILSAKEQQWQVKSLDAAVAADEIEQFVR